MMGTPMAVTTPPETKEGEEPVSPLTDEEATALGHATAARYVPPDPPPSVIEQLNAMKAGAAPAPAPVPPPQPDPPTAGA
jgi:hypothetical protein